VAKKNVGRIPRAIAHVPVTQIGEITSVRRIFLTGEDGSRKELEPKGWDPFR